MATKKIVVNGQTKMDLTDTTATVTDVAKGKVFYGANGERCIGSATEGGGGLVEKDINFFDYDGTLLYSYTIEEAKSLRELPEGPNHEDMGLWFDEWNWTLYDIQSEKAFADVGASFLTYDPSIAGSNKNITKVYVDGSLLHTTEVSLYLSTYGATEGIKIDWGDGSDLYVQNGNFDAWVEERHEYPDEGQYIISLDIPANANVQFGSSSSGANFMTGSIYGMACGESVQSLAGMNEFIGMDMVPLQFLTFTSKLSTIAGSFMESGAIKYLALPAGIVGSFSNMFMSSYNVGLNILSVAPEKGQEFATSFNSEYYLIPPCPLKRWVMPTKDGFYNFDSIIGSGDICRYQITKVNLTHLATVPTLSSSPYEFSGIGSNQLIFYVPKALENNYKTATNWSSIAHLIKGV